MPTCLTVTHYTAPNHKCQHFFGRFFYFSLSSCNREAELVLFAQSRDIKKKLLLGNFFAGGAKQCDRIFDSSHCEAPEMCKQYESPKLSMRTNYKKQLRFNAPP